MATRVSGCVLYFLSLGVIYSSCDVGLCANQFCPPAYGAVSKMVTLLSLLKSEQPQCDALPLLFWWFIHLIGDESRTVSADDWWTFLKKRDESLLAGISYFSLWWLSSSLWWRMRFSVVADSLIFIGKSVSLWWQIIFYLVADHTSYSFWWQICFSHICFSRQRGQIAAASIPHWWSA